MPLIAHLRELRDRVLISVYAILGVFLAIVYFANDIYALLAKPMRDVMPENTQMIAYEVASPFLAPFKLTLWVAFIAAMPVVLYQIWSFIAPALYKREKRIAIPLFVSSVLLFYCGLAFAYFLVFHVVFGFFVSVVPDGIQIAPDINAYLSFALTVFFGFGVAFEIPVATVLLVWAGLVSPESLAKKRPYVIVGCFIAAAFLTPPDIWTQSMLAIPMWILYEIGVFCGRWIKPAENDANAAETQSANNN